MISTKSEPSMHAEFKATLNVKILADTLVNVSRSSSSIFRKALLQPVKGGRRAVSMCFDGGSQRIFLCDKLRERRDLMRGEGGIAAGTSERPVEAQAAGLLVFRLCKTAGQPTHTETLNADRALIHFLMLKASYHPYHWTPPKGHLDTGETAVAAALRETEEEAGFREEDLDVLPNFERVRRHKGKSLHYEARGKQKRTTYFLARLRDPDKAVRLSKEHTDFRWLSPEAAAEFGGFQDFKAVVMDAANYLEQHLLGKK